MAPRPRPWDRPLQDPDPAIRRLKTFDLVLDGLIYLGLSGAVDNKAVHEIFKLEPKVVPQWLPILNPPAASERHGKEDPTSDSEWPYERKD